MSSSPSAAPSDSVLVVIPTYNEAENLPRIVERLRAAVPDADLLVVDDSSPDGTGEIADKLAGADDAVKVLHRAGKEGLGRAYIAGFRWGLNHGYDVLVEMDADGSHAPEQLPRLLGAGRYADLVIGSRYVPGGGLVNWPWQRELLSKAANLYVRMALGLPVRDATAGYRAYSAEVLRELDLDTIESHGYCFQVDLTMRTIDSGFGVTEVPITFTEREVGESKMSGGVISESFTKIGIWGVRRRLRQLGNLGKRAVGLLRRRSDR
ncbi:polyprenol monophosphomannose synthase [Nakamurella aerolata]|uniref:polyprenol monophosphomannose synthase n=1 Tax=Nakamurella aerolata TaxID=1656892 RepID=UPI0031B62EA8